MKLGIYGAGGLGKEIYDLSLRINCSSNKWSEIVFIDDVKDEGLVLGTRCVRFKTFLGTKPEEFECIIAIGEPSIRATLFEKMSQQNVKPAILIDPSAIVSPTATISAGSIICEHSSIHADVCIGVNCLVQPYCVIGHDTIVGDHTVLSSHCAPGGCLVFGKRVFAGMHSSVKEKLHIGDDVIIAMGASVFQDLPAGVTVVGNPARITRGREDRKVF